MNDLQQENAIGAAILDAYQEDGYEFSIRLPDYRRLWVHVTRAALEVLNQGHPPADQLAVLMRQMPLLYKLALQQHEQTGNERVVIGAAALSGATFTVQVSDHGRPP